MGQPLVQTGIISCYIDAARLHAGIDVLDAQPGEFASRLAVGLGRANFRRRLVCPATGETRLHYDRRGCGVSGSVITTAGDFDPIKQGAFNPAGVDPAGQTLHGDHTYVFYQVPEDARQLPLVFWHGHGQSGKTWETTSDGREGFQNIFLRRRFPVYLIDQPRRGRAARSTEPTAILATPDEQIWFGIFRLGAWPDFYEGVQFSRDPEALNQFFRQMVPNTGPYDVQVNTEAVSALFDKVGPIQLAPSGHRERAALSARPGCAPVLRHPGEMSAVSREEWAIIRHDRDTVLRTPDLKLEIRKAISKDHKNSKASSPTEASRENES